MKPTKAALFIFLNFQFSTNNIKTQSIYFVVLHICSPTSWSDLFSFQWLQNFCQSSNTQLNSGWGGTRPVVLAYMIKPFLWMHTGHNVISQVITCPLGPSNTSPVYWEVVPVLSISHSVSSWPPHLTTTTTSQPFSTFMASSSVVYKASHSYSHTTVAGATQSTNSHCELHRVKCVVSWQFNMWSWDLNHRPYNWLLSLWNPTDFYIMATLSRWEI